MRVAAILCAVLLIPSSGLGQSTFNPNDPVRGKYSGIISVDGMPQPVWLEVSALTPGKVGAVLRYSKPRGSICRKWEYGGPGPDAHYFYGGSQGCHLGGGVWASILTVRLTEGGGLRYELRQDKNTILESQVLMPE